MSSAYQMRGSGSLRGHSALDSPKKSAKSTVFGQDDGIRKTRNDPRRSLTALKLPSGFRFAVGSAGDHFAIRQFLVSVFHGPSEAEFATAIEEPTYDPTDRLLIKHRNTVVAHVLTRKRLLRMGNVSIPVGQICQLAALPEYRGKGLASALLQSAERILRYEDAVLAVMRTKLPDFFRPHGWGTYAPYSLSRAGLRSLLRELGDVPPPPRRSLLYSESVPKLEIRPWRQIEWSGVKELYENELANKVSGTWSRSDDFWRWLIEKRDFDQIFVATLSTGEQREPIKNPKRGRPKTELENIRPSEVVAYAVQRGDQITEFVVRDGDATLGRPLLAHICFELLERGFHELTLHAQLDDPAHAWFHSAGRATQQLDNLNGHFLMGKVLDPLRVLQLLIPLLEGRLPSSTAPNWQLGVQIGKQQFLFEIKRGHLTLSANEISRNYASMSPTTFLSLVCGQLDAQQAIAAGALSVSTKLASKRFSELFFRAPFVWPAWDS